ncbi:hypothetical protein NH340_JMT03433 [Sarcoptes scabiei]|nr:hypothetical protein NH340_JMT03433 [Sarcoptes scabiei]
MQQTKRSLIALRVSDHNRNIWIDQESDCKRIDQSVVNKMKRSKSIDLFRDKALWIIIIIAIIFGVLPFPSKAQCPIGTTMSFEKIASVTIRGVPFVPLYNGQPDIPVTAECNNRCRAGAKCRSFLLSYDKHQCFGFDYESLNRGISIVSTTDKTSYFEKICLSTAPCEKAWTFERVMGKELNGFDNRVLSGVASRLRCQELCLKERSFVCRSGEYDYALQLCRLSSEDRRSQPSSFQTAASSSVDYFENQCAANQQAALQNQQQQQQQQQNGQGQSTAISSSPMSVGCDFERYENLDIRRADLIRTAFSIDQCRSLCEATRAFVCRSFTYASATSQCWLNSDDILAVANGLNGLESHAGATYFQRGHCLDLQLFCGHDSMTVSLNTLNPFNGRLYAKENPIDCESMGRSETSTLLTMPFNSRSGCGVREEDGKYTSMVVIQHHPLIQRKGDRMVHVACHFETTNRTISNTYSVLVEMPPVAETSIVNATAPSPNIRLRITDKEGKDITGARLGDELYLRIEMDDDEVFGIFARELIAKSGNNKNESIMLIDSDGCPTDPNIFPSLERSPNSKGLISKFDAFKFADDVVVRFQVNVQFCLQECLPVNCDNSRHVDSDLLKNSQSWGRRRRRRSLPTVMDDGKFRTNNTELHREIIVESVSRQSMKNKENSERLKSSDRERHHQEDGDEEREHQTPMYCASKISVIIGFITMFMIQITFIGSIMACCTIYNRSLVKSKLTSTDHHHHQHQHHRHQHQHHRMFDNLRRSKFANIIETLPKSKNRKMSFENDSNSIDSSASLSTASGPTTMIVKQNPLHCNALATESCNQQNLWTHINHIE